MNNIKQADPANDKFWEVQFLENLYFSKKNIEKEIESIDPKFHNLLKLIEDFIDVNQRIKEQKIKLYKLLKEKK